jgi:hypothetical protein
MQSLLPVRLQHRHPRLSLLGMLQQMLPQHSKVVRVPSPLMQGFLQHAAVLRVQLPRLVCSFPCC